MTWQWSVQDGILAPGQATKPQHASQDGTSETSRDREGAGFRGPGGGEGPRRSKDTSKSERRVREEGHQGPLADSPHQQESCPENPAASVRHTTNTSVSPRHHNLGDGHHTSPREEQEGGRQGSTGGGPRASCKGPWPVRGQGSEVEMQDRDQ